MISAKEWYETFYSSYYGFPAIRQGKKVTEAEWTRIMKEGLLATMGTKLGYTIARETLRVDQMWKMGGKLVVAIEHENWFSGFEKELANLCDVSAPLRVLLTYVANGDLNWRPYELAGRVKKYLDERQMQGEFLLLVSDEDSDVWVAFSFDSKLVFEVAVLQPPRPGLKAAETKRQVDIVRRA